MEVKLNGETANVSSKNLAELLEELTLADKRVAIEVNKQLVTRKELALTEIKAGDAIEIVHFVGGG